MKGPVIALVLFGCDCDGVKCEYIQTVSRDWQSVEGCERAMAAQTRAGGTISYPLVVARCTVQAREPAQTVTPAAASEAEGPLTASAGDGGWRLATEMLAHLPQRAGEEAMSRLASAAASVPSIRTRSAAAAQRLLGRLGP